jgi:hypothetical protein
MIDETHYQNLKRYIKKLDALVDAEAKNLKTAGSPLRTADYDRYLRLVKRRNILLNKSIFLLARENTNPPGNMDKLLHTLTTNRLDIQR